MGQIKKFILITDFNLRILGINSYVDECCNVILESDK